MDRDERLAVALRAFVVLGLEAQARQRGDSIPREFSDEVRAASNALLAAMSATGEEATAIDVAVAAAWIGTTVETFEYLAAKELARRVVENDTPVERQIRDAMDGASWRAMSLADRLRIEADDAVLAANAHVVTCPICIHNDERSYEGSDDLLGDCAELDRLRATARQARRAYESAP